MAVRPWSSDSVSGSPPLHRISATIHHRQLWPHRHLSRPKVEKEEAHSSEDVQRLYIVLRPEEIENKHESSHESSSTAAANPNKRKIIKNRNANGAHGETPSPKQRQAADESEKSAVQEVDTQKQILMRLMVMGKKSFPDPHEKSRRPYWGFVEMVTTNIDDLKNAFKGGEYDTSTRGHRHTSSARALGEGIYQMLKHINPGGKNKKTHTHLIYKLRFPHEEEKHENSPQESLNIEHEASFLIQIKNPSSSGGFKGFQSKRKAEFPPYLEKKIEKLRYFPADPTEFLNYEGCEFLLIAASDDVSNELGVEIEAEEYETLYEAAAEAKCSDLLKTFGESGISDLSSSSIAPLLKGIWA